MKYIEGGMTTSERRLKIHLLRSIMHYILI